MQPGTLELLSHTPLPLAEEACRMFDRWWEEYNPHPGQYYEVMQKQLRKTPFESFPNHERYPKDLGVVSFGLSYRVACLMQHLGASEVDRWWKQQGKAQFWDTATQKPTSELAHLLVLAAQKACMPLTRWALNNGWSPRVQGAEVMPPGHMTPLHHWAHAFFKGQHWYDLHNIFRPLLTPETINARCADGKTPLAVLMRNARGAYGDTVRLCSLFIDAGADVTLADKKGMTPLHWVGRRGIENKHSRDLIELLLKAGADPVALTHKGHPPFYFFESTVPPYGEEVRARLEQAALDRRMREAEQASPVFQRTRTPVRGRL